MFQAIVSDLDGTLLNRQHQISPYSARVLRALAAQGIDVVLASGRPFADVEPLRRQLAIPMFLITSNGAQIHSPDGALLTQSAMPAHLIGDLITEGRAAKVHINIYRGEEWWVEDANPALLAMHQSSGFQYQQQDLQQLAHQEIIKVFFEGSPATLRRLERRLVDRFGEQLTIAFSLENILEVMAPGVNKGLALAQVLPRLSIAAEQVMAFGDGLNDLEMLQAVGRGLVMTNAHPRLRTALPAHEVIGRNCADAVACYLQKNLLRAPDGALPVRDLCAPHPCTEALCANSCEAIRQQLQPLRKRA